MKEEALIVALFMAEKTNFAEAGVAGFEIKFKEQSQCLEQLDQKLKNIPINFWWLTRHCTEQSL